MCALFNFNCQQKHNANLRQDTDMHINHHSVHISINCIYIYIHIPGTPMTSIFEGQPPKTRCFPTKTRVIWVPGIYKYIICVVLIDQWCISNPIIQASPPGSLVGKDCHLWRVVPLKEGPGKVRSVRNLGKGTPPMPPPPQKNKALIR